MLSCQGHQSSLRASEALTIDHAKEDDHGRRRSPRRIAKPTHAQSRERACHGLRARGAQAVPCQRPHLFLVGPARPRDPHRRSPVGGRRRAQARGTSRVARCRPTRADAVADVRETSGPAPCRSPHSRPPSSLSWPAAGRCLFNTRLVRSGQNPKAPAQQDEAQDRERDELRSPKCCLFRYLPS